MPLHDWTPLPAGLFHHFHQDWSIEIARALNRGILPEAYSALVEQRSGRTEGDVLAIDEGDFAHDAGGRTAVKEPPAMPRPVTRFVHRADSDAYAAKANRIVVKHHLGRTVAVIEIVSPGNKSSQKAVDEFVEKSIGYLRAGIHLLVVDPFPPTRRDPHGLHPLIWSDFADVDFDFPAGQNRLLVSYETGDEKFAYAETIGVGEVLPDMPLFLASQSFVEVPLEATYRTAWEASPRGLRRAVESPGSNGSGEAS